MTNISPVPTGFNTVNVSLIFKDARKALDFYEQAFGATPGVCMTAPGGEGIMHAEMRIGNSTLMIGEEMPDWPMKSAETMGGSPASIHLYVDDVDALFTRAIGAGCKEVQPVMDMFWGDRYGKLMDPFGYEWGIATHIEEVSDSEMQERGEQWMKQMASENA